MVTGSVILFMQHSWNKHWGASEWLTEGIWREKQAEGGKFLFKRQPGRATVLGCSMPWLDCQYPGWDSEPSCGFARCYHWVHMITWHYFWQLHGNLQFHKFKKSHLKTWHFIKHSSLPRYTLWLIKNFSPSDMNIPIFSQLFYRLLKNYQNYERHILVLRTVWAA